MCNIKTVLEDCTSITVSIFYLVLVYIHHFTFLYDFLHKCTLVIHPLGGYFANREPYQNMQHEIQQMVRMQFLILDK